MKAKAFLLVCALTLTLATNGKGQGSNKTESDGSNKIQSADAQKPDETRQDTAKNLIQNMRATLHKMKEQEEILKELVADPSSARAAYAKFKEDGAPVRAKAEEEEAKEGGATSVLHKRPGRTKAGEVSEVDSGAASPAERDAAIRRYSTNNLKQLSLDLEKDANKFHRLSRGTKRKTFLMEVERLQAEARRVREVAKRIPVKPDPAADEKAMEALSAAVQGVEARLESVSLSYNQTKE